VRLSLALLLTACIAEAGEEKERPPDPDTASAGELRAYVARCVRAYNAADEDTRKLSIPRAILRRVDLTRVPVPEI